MKRLALALASALCLVSALLAFDTTKEPVAPDGTRAAIDLPPTQHMQNTGGSDGAGLCVYTSVTVAARWQNLPDMLGFRKFAEARPGGSYPEKLDADLKAYASRNAFALPPYVQHTGGDESFLDLCMATRRMPGITYAGMDGFYDSAVAHMVDLATLDKTHGAIIDNNRAGSWVWGTRSQIVNRWKGNDDNGKALLVPFRQGLRIVWGPVGGGWAFVWLGPPAPPRPPSVNETIVAPPPTPGPVRVWERELIDDEPYWMLYEDGTLVWVVDPMLGWHRAVGPDEWEEKVSEKPEGVSSPQAPEPTQNWNNGIDVERVGRVHRYWISGVECSRAKAFAAVSDPGGLLDDSDKYHLSVIGDRKAVAALFAPGGSLEKYARRVHVQVYSATDWPAKDRLSTTVTLQEPAKIGGRVVGASGTADPVAVGKVLADVFDAPTPAPPVPPPSPLPKPDPAPPVKPNPVVPGWLQVLLAVLAAILATRKGK